MSQEAVEFNIDNPGSGPDSLSTEALEKLTLPENTPATLGEIILTKGFLLFGVSFFAAIGLAAAGLSDPVVRKAIGIDPR
jgi:hypothetical protein